MTYERKCSFWQILFVVASILVLVLLYLLLEMATPVEGHAENIKHLGANTIPSIIATLCAVIGTLIFANRLTDRQEQLSRARDFGQSVISLSGSWRLRDWRHDYHEEYEEDHDKPEPPDDLEWYKGRELHCKSEERKDREWKCSSDVRLEQVGDSVEGYFSHHDSGRRKTVRYRIDGRVKGHILTGKWREIVPDKQIFWFGTVQLIIDEGDRVRGKTMLGRWTGTNSNGKMIRCGAWEFVETDRAFEQAPWPSGVIDTSPATPQ